MLSPIWLERFWQWLALPALRAGGLGLLLGLWLRRRHWTATALMPWWRALLYAAICMPLLGLLPGYRVSIPDLLASRKGLPAAITNVPAAAPAAIRAQGTTPNLAPAANTIPASTEAGSAASEIIETYRSPARFLAAAITIPAAKPAAAGNSVSSFWPVLASFGLVLYLLVAGLLGARWLAAWLMTRRLAEAGTPFRMSGKGGRETDEKAQRVLRQECRRLGLRRAPALHRVNLPAPLTTGWRRPVVLLPEDSEDWNEAKLSMVLAHELAHIARRDYVHRLLSGLHVAVFWFSPLSWWLDRRLHELSEQAADEAVVSSGIAVTAYAEMLLGFMGRLRGGELRRWSWLGRQAYVPLAQPGRMARRLERLLAPAPEKAGGNRLAAVLAVPLIYGLAGLHIGAMKPISAAAKNPARPAAAHKTLPARPAGHDVIHGRQSATPQGAGVNSQAGAARRGPSSVPLRASGPPIGAYYLHTRHSVAAAGDSLAGENLGGNYLWFRSGGKSYVIRDPKVLAAARRILISPIFRPLAQPGWIFNAGMTPQLQSQLEALQQQFQSQMTHSRQALEQSLQALQKQQWFSRRRMDAQLAAGQKAMRQALAELQLHPPDLSSLHLLLNENKLPPDLRLSPDNSKPSNAAMERAQRQWRQDMAVARLQMRQAQKQMELAQRQMFKAQAEWRRKWQQQYARQFARAQADMQRLRRRNWKQIQERMAQAQRRMRQDMARDQLRIRRQVQAMRARQRRMQQRLRQLLRRAVRTGVAKPVKK